MPWGIEETIVYFSLYLLSVLEKKSSFPDDITCGRTGRRSLWPCLCQNADTNSEQLNVCTRPMQVQTRLNPSMEGGVGNKTPPLAAEWLASISCWERESLFSLIRVYSPGQTMVLHWKSTCSRIFEHYKLVLSKKKKKDTKLDGWGRRRWVWEDLQGGEHDQVMLYGILKELIQFLKMQNKACTSSSRVAMPIFQTHSEAGPNGANLLSQLLRRLKQEDQKHRACWAPESVEGQLGSHRTVLKYRVRRARDVTVQSTGLACTGPQVHP